MALFSERNKITPKKALQLENLDDETRISIFNKIYYCYSEDSVGFSSFDEIFDEIYLDFFKKSAEKLRRFKSLLNYEFRELENYIIESEWYEAFDLIEFILEIDSNNNSKSCLKDNLNLIFEKENVAYRIINWEVTPITEEMEIDSIEKSINNSPIVVKKHLQKALILLSDKTRPDYKNSIKESISAVESACRLILEDKKISLGKALKQIEKENKVEINGALKESFNTLYGFTSSESGVRHGSFEHKEIDFDLAKYFVVSCSAFVNYLLSKSNL
ncbi:MAG: hypothetical protein FWH29_02355 [Methanobrevibacter sp.]|nr:hypothetical protein [Methanobrevibacter sp.]